MRGIAGRIVKMRRVRPVHRLLYRAVIRGELMAEAVLDRLARPPGAGDDTLLNQVTAVVKTFERPATVRRLVASIHRLYPGLRIVVVDDSREPAAIPGVEMVRLPYDSGISAGRSAGLRQVQTPYVAMMDDDHVFFRRTDLAGALRALEAYPEIDLMGGKVINLPRYHVADYRDAFVFPTTAEPTRPPGSFIGPFPVYEKVASFFVARTERVRLVGWDLRIKRLDHADFFARARGVLTTVYNEHFQCLHARTPHNARYMERRYAVEADLELLRQRYYAAGSKEPASAEGPRRA